MSYYDLEKIFLQLHDYGVQEVYLTGGEPLLRNDFSKLIKLIHSYDIKIVLHTNGYFIDRIDSLNELMKDIKEITISIYGMDKDTYTAVTGHKDSFEKVKNNVELLVNNNHNVRLRYVVLKQNYTQIASYFKWCKQLNLTDENSVFMLDIYPANNGTTETTENDLTQEELETFLSLVYSIRPNALQTALDPEEELQMCAVARQACHIDCSGDIYPCPNFPIVAGNIHQESFKKIWENSKELNMLRNYDIKEHGCYTCNIKNKCHKRCFGALYVWNEMNSFSPNTNFCNRKKVYAMVVDNLINQSNCL